MRQTAEFQTFGVAYRCKEFSAVEGFAMINDLDTAQPREMLVYTDVLTEKGKWLPLSDVGNVNAYVRDVCFVLRPHEALQGVMTAVRRFNFGFLNFWKPVKIPRRFVVDIEQTKLENINPVLGRLLSEHLATLNELQNDYSTKDAFDMYDVWAVDGLNKVLATEASMKESRDKHR
jgi:hypothetical protein